MVIIAVAFVASILFGFSDYLGGVASRGARVIAITSLSYITATIAYVIGLAFVPSVWSTENFLYGAASGVAAIFGFVGFYAALASGPIAIMSPSIALIQTIIPVIVGVTLQGEHLGVVAWIGVALAVAGAWLMGSGGHAGGRVPMKSVILALMAGSMFALSLIFLDMSPASAGLTPGLVEMVLGFVILAAVWWGSTHVHWLDAVTRLLDVDPYASNTTTALTRRTVTLALGAGGLMGAASALTLVALHGGQLAIVSAVVALYPLGTVALARVLLNERLAMTQWVGIGLAVAACVALSL